MLKILLILLLCLIQSIDGTVYSCNASVSCGCSTYSATVTRIVGGEAASSATWGWAVSLDIADGYVCGGSIISSSWVVTAAHCVNGRTASEVTIYAGSTVRWGGSNSRAVSQIIVHPSYNDQTYVYDIALLKLATPLDMSDPNVSTICLPSVSSTTLAAGEWPPAGTTVVAVGWGVTSEGGSLPNTLRQVTVQTVDYRASTCSPSMYDWHVQFCAGVSGGGKDTCQGDSGGPLMMFMSSKQWVLVGVTSNGIGCAEAAHSGLYTRVAAFQSWINSATNGAFTSVSSTASTTRSSSIWTTMSRLTSTITSTTSSSIRTTFSRLTSTVSATASHSSKKIDTTTSVRNSYTSTAAVSIDDMLLLILFSSLIGIFYEMGC